METHPCRRPQDPRRRELWLQHGAGFILFLLHNHWLLAGLFVGNALQVAVVFWSPLARVFHTTPFDLGEALAIGAVGRTPRTI